MLKGFSVREPECFEKFWPGISSCLSRPTVNRHGLWLILCNLPNDLGLRFTPLTTHLSALAKLRAGICSVERAHTLCVCVYDGLMREFSGASLPCSTACLRVSAQSVSQPNPSLSPSATTQQEDLKRRHFSSPQCSAAIYWYCFSAHCSCACGMRFVSSFLMDSFHLCKLVSSHQSVFTSLGYQVWMCVCVCSWTWAGTSQRGCEGSCHSKAPPTSNSN